jgi:phage-related protein
VATLRYDIDVDVRQAERRIGSFAATMRSQITQAVRSLPEIQIDADSSDAQRELAQIRSELVDLGRQRIGVDIDAGAAQARIAELNSRLHELTVSSADIQVRTDTAAALAALTGVEATVERLDGRTATIKVDTDRSWADAVIQVARLGSALGAIALPAALIAATPQMVSLAGAAVEASGALLLLPAAGLAAAAGIGTLVVGFQGLGDALGPTGTPAQLEKVNEALAGLAPSARATVDELRSLAPAWDRLRLNVQQQLFEDVADIIGKLAGTYLPLLSDMMGRIAGSFNYAGQEVSRFLLAPSTVPMITGLFANLENTIENLSKSFLPLVQVFLQVASIGAEFLPGLATGFTNVVMKVREFVTSAQGIAQIKDWIQGGIDTIRQLFDIVGSGGGILSGLFDAAKSAGVDFMGTMVTATDLTDTFLNSGVGQTSLTSIFKSINDTVAALLPGLVAVGAAVGQGLVALGPALPPLAASFAAIAIALAPLITDLALLTSVILPPLAAVLASISPLLGPIAAGLLGMLVVSQVTAAFVLVNTALVGFVVRTGAMTAAAAASAGPLALLRGAILAIGFAIAANPIGILITALVAVGAALVFAYNHVEGFRNVVDTAFAAVRAAVGAVLDWFAGPFVDGVVAAVTTVVDFVRNLPANIAAAISSLGTTIAAAATAAWRWLVTSAQNAGAAVLAFLAGLPQQIAHGLGFLAGLLVRAGIDGFNGLLTGITTAWAATVAFVQSVPGLIVAGLAALGSLLVNAAVTGWAGFTTGIANAFTATLAFVQSIPGLIVAELVSLGAFLTSAATTAGNGFLTGIITAFTAVIRFFAELPGRIVAALGAAGTWLLQVGADVINGLLTGLRNAATGISNWITGLVGSFIQGFKDGLGIASPSTVFAQIGVWIIEGLLNGLRAVGQLVIDFVVSLGTMLVDAFTAAVGVLQGLWTSFWSGLSAVASTAFGAISAVVSTVWRVIQAVFGGATAAVLAGWSAFWGGLSAVASAVFNAIRVVIETVWNAIRGVFTSFISTHVQGWTIFWATLQNVATTVWNAIAAFIAAVWAAIQARFNAAVAFVTGLWSGFWATLQSVATTVWNAIAAFIASVWAAIQAGFNAAVAFVTGLWNGFWTALQRVATTVWNAIASFIVAVWASIQAGFNAAVAFVSGLWTRFWDGLSTVTRTVFNGIKGTIDTVIAGIITAFQFVVRSVGEIWNGIKRLLAVPINFMIGTVYNNGIVKAWNFVAGLLGIGTIRTLPLIPEFASGGPVLRETVLRAGEAGPEYILSAPAVRNLGGIAAVDRMHQNALTPQDTLAVVNSGRVVEGADHNGPGTSTSGFGGVKPWVAQAGYYLKAKYGIGAVGGVGARANASDHPKGLALDFMTRGENGTALANEVIANKGHYGVTYAIWRQQINNGSGWRGMENRGNDTANHFDHVHVSFSANPGDSSATGDIGGGGFFNFVLDQVRKLYDEVTSPIPGLITGLVGAPPPEFRRIPPAMATKAIASVGDFLFGKAEEFGGALTGGADAGVGPVADQVRGVANRYGWGAGPQWDALARLIQKESSWNPTAQNPTSTAYGLFQFLDGTWGTVGATKTSNPGLQAEAGLRYIQQSYVTPVGALTFHDRNNYYDAGGVAVGRGFMPKSTPLPERVLSPAQTVSFDRLVGILDQPRGATPSVDLGRLPMPPSNAGLEKKFDQLMQILERRGAGASITVNDRSGDPAETARSTVLALRLS